MKRYRYDLAGATAGICLSAVTTLIAAARATGGLTRANFWSVQVHEPLLWIMDLSPFVLGGLGAVILRQTRFVEAQQRRISELELVQREGFSKAACELTQAAQGLLGSVSSFTAITAETAASVRKTTATMTQLSHTATASALTAETVIGLALESERASEQGLGTAETTSAELLELAEEVRDLSQRIEALNGRMREIFEIASVVTYIADRSQRLAEAAGAEAERAGAAGLGFKAVADQMSRHAEDARRAAASVKSILGEVHKDMIAAMTAAEMGSQRAKTGSEVVNRAGETIRRLANALRNSAKAAKEIAQVAQLQESGIEQVLHVMNEIYFATEQTTASTHQVAAGARSLNELASNLQRVVER